MSRFYGLEEIKGTCAIAGERRKVHRINWCLVISFEDMAHNVCSNNSQVYHLSFSFMPFPIHIVAHNVGNVNHIYLKEVCRLPAEFKKLLDYR